MKCATEITTAWRCFRDRYAYCKKQKAMISINYKTLPFVRLFLSRKHNDQFLQCSCQVAENGLAGRVMFKNSYTIEIQNQILGQSCVPDPSHASDLQHIFATYCGYSHKGNTTRLGVGGFSRLAKEVPNLMQPMNKKGLSQSDVELTFMKHRGRSRQFAVESHLHYIDFLKAIRSLAVIFFTFNAQGPYLGSDTSFSIFLQRYVFQSKVASSSTEHLLVQSCVGRANAQVKVYTRKITALWRNHKARVVAGTKKKMYLNNVSDIRRSNAATSLQKKWRGVEGRRVAANIAQDSYEKFIDFECGREFWFNKKLKKSVWVKPQSLAWLDVGNPIMMPDADLLFEVRCLQCSNFSITRYCVECDDLYCEECHSSGHQGKRHTSVNIDLCVQCHFQIGAKANTKIYYHGTNPFLRYKAM